MKTFNKVVTVVGLLLAFVLLPVIAAIPLEILNTVRDFLFGAETGLTTGARLLIAALAVILWVLVVVLLWLEFRPSRQATIRVAAVEGGAATVQSRSVERRIEQSLMVLPAIQAAQARVEQGKNGVSANLVLDTDADVNVPEVTAMAIQRTRYLLEKEVGASVSTVNVRVRHVAAKARRVAPAAPVVPVVPVIPVVPVVTPAVPAARVFPAEPVVTHPEVAAPVAGTYTPAPDVTSVTEYIVPETQVMAPSPTEMAMEPPAPAYEPDEADWRAGDGEPEAPPAEDDGLAAEDEGSSSSV